MPRYLFFFFFFSETVARLLESVSRARDAGAPGAQLRGDAREAAVDVLGREREAVVRPRGRQGIVQRAVVDERAPRDAHPLVEAPALDDVGEDERRASDVRLAEAGERHEDLADGDEVRVRADREREPRLLAQHLLELRAARPAVARAQRLHRERLLGLAVEEPVDRAERAAPEHALDEPDVAPVVEQHGPRRVLVAVLARLVVLEPHDAAVQDLEAVAPVRDDDLERPPVVGRHAPAEPRRRTGPIFLRPSPGKKKKTGRRRGTDVRA